MMTCIAICYGHLTFTDRSQGTICNSRENLWALGKKANGLGQYAARSRAEGNTCTGFDTGYLMIHSPGRMP